MSDDLAGASANRAGRRAERRRAARRRRRRLGGVVLAILLLVGGALAAVQLRGSAGTNPHRAVAAHRTQQTLLLQVQAPDGITVGNALLAHDPASSTGAGLLIPPSMLLTVPGAGSQTVGTALRSVAADATRGAVSDLLGVTVDGGWVLDAASLERLVDALGGVHLEVDVPVLGGPQGQTVLVGPGAALLDGTRAREFAFYLGPGELEQARLARVQQLVTAVLSALPPAAAQVQVVLAGLGPGSVPTVSPSWLAGFLSGLRADGQAHAVEFDSLPVVPIDLGTGTLAFRIDAPATRQLVDRLLAPSVPPGARATGNRVLVLNGVGTPGLGQRVRGRLLAAGFVFVGSRNAAHFGYGQSVALVHDATTQGQALGARVCRAIGVPVNVATADLGDLADVVVIVGEDFRG